MALLILALLQRRFLMTALMMLLVWLIFFMVLIKLLQILGCISDEVYHLCNYYVKHRKYLGIGSNLSKTHPSGLTPSLLHVFMPPNHGGFFMVRSYYPSECPADYFDFERTEALKPPIVACGI